MTPVEVSARELFDLVQQVNTRVIVLSEKVERIGPDHEERIRSLEKARWPLATIAVLAPVLALLYVVFVDFGLGR